MSIQILVESPLSYYSDWDGIFCPRWHARKFSAIIYKHFNIKLENILDKEICFLEDLFSGALCNLDEFLSKSSLPKATIDALNADIYLPYQIDIPKEVPIKHFAGPKTSSVSSTKHFLEAVKTIKQIIDPQNENYEEFMEILDTYKEIIKFSDKVKQPIFWSY